MLEKTRGSAAELEHALSRLAFLLELQLGLSRSEFSLPEVEKRLAADDAGPRCDD